jgi:hypothetical protein
MLRREQVVERLADVVVKRLVVRKCIDVKGNEARARAAVKQIIAENFQIEEQIDAEAKKILQDHAKELRDKTVDYSRLLSMVRGKLAREKGFIL